MFMNYRSNGAMSVVLRQSCAGAVAGLALFTAGCSADITRFNDPPFGLTDTTGSRSTPTPRAPLTRGADANSFDQTSNSGSFGASRAPVANNYNGVRTAALPEIQGGDTRAQRARYVPSARAPAPSYDSRPSEAARKTPELMPEAESGTSGGEVVVRRGDTLYGLSRRHGVSLNALMRANGLEKSNLRPGQVLKLPSGAIANTAPATGSRTSPTTARKADKAVAASPAPSSWGKSYTVERGDSLYKIARQFGIKTTDLQRYNGIDNPRLVRPGTVLKVPGAGGRDVPVATTEARGDTTDTSTRLSTPKNSGGAGSRVAVINAKPVVGNGAPRVVQSVKVAPPAVQSPDKTKLRWPVRGKVISKFGRRSDGTHNDGINLEVPLGTDIKAAEKGVVAYSGSELRGYGKLILVRHENGWVTAYAHNRDVLVKRGDKVARGQVIAKAGKTGQVDRPQVHFELRRDAKPVDPLPYLEAL